MTRFFALLAVVLLTSACESNEKKLARLEREKTTACLNERASFRKLNEVRFPGGVTRESVHTPPTPAAESLGKEWMSYRTKCELATREYDRFMR
jgi:hypothetical protein